MSKVLNLHPILHSPHIPHHDHYSVSQLLREHARVERFTGLPALLRTKLGGSLFGLYQAALPSKRANGLFLLQSVQ